MKVGYRGTRAHASLALFRIGPLVLLSAQCEALMLLLFGVLQLSSRINVLQVNSGGLPALVAMCCGVVQCCQVEVWRSGSWLGWLLGLRRVFGDVQVCCRGDEGMVVMDVVAALELSKRPLSCSRLVCRSVLGPHLAMFWPQSSSSSQLLPSDGFHWFCRVQSLSTPHHAVVGATPGDGCQWTRGPYRPTLNRCCCKIPAVYATQV